ncbi:hypothetical protein HU230_0042270 (plasmid) [Bradyrhizobium quebecense]|uniref:OLD protein-like TOPRIM domain-containing protein n=1 Tax=Bradyrhizobium quebecense TaxID=2748629 RepID=A0A973WX69_9BRAD|nr:TOPRIM nucleotidyl transferase/hydrolase domain-containing protein [Bradyrhizobium quebecense]UGA48881.1 hypothetical protein HU230_0042270 [Bradyrhizobium quebecense]
MDADHPETGVLIPCRNTEALVPVFAQSMGRPLDELGITVCNVAGVNFSPYVKLAESLSLPYAVITDWDPLDGSKPPLGRKRTIALWQDMLEVRRQPELTPVQLAEFETKTFAEFAPAAANSGVFLNDRTFEVSIASTPALLHPLLDILDQQGFGSTRTNRIAAWRAGTSAVDPTQLLAMIADIGKGRLGSRLSRKMIGLPPPQYIADAITNVANRV